MINAAEETPPLGLHSIVDYVPLIGEPAVERIRAKIAALAPSHLVNICSRNYVGGDPEGQQIFEAIYKSIDVIQAADRLSQVLTDGNLRQRLGQRAHKTARVRFPMSRLVKDWVDLLGGMLPWGRACG